MVQIRANIVCEGRLSQKWDDTQSSVCCSSSGSRWALLVPWKLRALDRLRWRISACTILGCWARPSLLSFRWLWFRTCTLFLLAFPYPIFCWGYRLLIWLEMLLALVAQPWLRSWSSIEATSPWTIHLLAWLSSISILLWRVWSRTDTFQFGESSHSGGVASSLSCCS